MIRKFDPETGTLTLDEFALHDLVVSQNYAVEHDGTLHCISHVKIVPTRPELFTKDLVDKWEQQIQDVVLMLSRVDADLHDDAEYTC